ncbi:thioredoxin family protein [[Eubacterium] cellulosolvens]
MSVTMEVFTAEPPCAGCTKLLQIADDIAQKYKGKVEVLKHIGPSKEFEAYRLTLVPAVVFNKGKIKIIGVCPSRETLIASLKEMGI